MTPDEARDWLCGDLSHVTTMVNTKAAGRERIIDTEKADAATAERAYWVLRAEKDGLL